MHEMVDQNPKSDNLRSVGELKFKGFNHFSKENSNLTKKEEDVKEETCTRKNWKSRKGESPIGPSEKSEENRKEEKAIGRAKLRVTSLPKRAKDCILGK